MKQPFHIMIPVRLHSKRLPQKALRDVQGKPLIQRVYENARTLGAISVTIATDSIEIKNLAETFDAPVCMTKTEHRNGTERLGEAVDILNFSENDIIVNVQGDEPLLPSAAVENVVALLREHPNAQMSTLATQIKDPADLQNPNVVKVLFSNLNQALLFSRAPIPYSREATPVLDHVYRHIGLYAYRVSFLKTFLNLQPSPFEDIEQLEQLRALWHHQTIQIGVMAGLLPRDINTQSDLNELQTYLSENDCAV